MISILLIFLIISVARWFFTSQRAAFAKVRTTSAFVVLVESEINIRLESILDKKGRKDRLIDRYIGIDRQIDIQADK